MPHGLGTIRADAGLYGGPNNFVWGGDNLPSGVPEIDNIEDLPQDQGGKLVSNIRQVLLIMLTRPTI